jgi:hypothetical protein
MRIDSSGRVGIGTTSPMSGAKLDVNGSLAIANTGQINLTRTLNTNNLWYGMRYDNNEVQIYTYYPSDRSITFNTVSGGTGITNQLMKIESGGNVGIGTSSPDYKLDLRSGELTVRSGSSGNGGLVKLGNSSSNAIVQLYDSSGNEDVRISTSLSSYFNGGSVGIGTTSPDAYLQIGDYPSNNIDITTYPDVPSEHMIHLTAPETNTRYGAGISFGENSFTAANITVQDAGGNGALHMLFGTRHTSGTIQERMRISSSGKVGVSNTNPNAFNSLGATAQIVIGDASAVSNITMYSSATGYGSVSFADSNSSSSSSQYSGLIQYYHSDNSMTFYTSANPRMRIHADGNVGIGTANPGSKLTVRKDSAGGRGGEISIVNYASNTIGNEAALNFGLEASTYAGDAGNAQIKARVMAANAASDMIFSTWNGSSFGERMRINNAGRVGIGNTNPQAALDISSSYSIQGGVYTYYTTGSTIGSNSLNFDITVNNEGGGGNVFKIEAGFAHYNGMTYNSIGEWWCTSRGTAVVNTYILNAGTTYAGNWSSSKPTTSVLRITKTAGTYPGGGKYWVKVTYRPY